MSKLERNKIEVNFKTYQRVKAFKEVIESVMGEKYEMDDFVEGLLDNGIDLLLEKLLGNVEPEILLQSLQQLGAKYPTEVYSYIAETIRRGGQINKEKLKEKLGFLVDR